MCALIRLVACACSRVPSRCVHAHTTHAHLPVSLRTDQVLYVVEKGKFEAYLRAKGDVPVKAYASGELFGELALMYNCPRAASVVCTQQGRLWGLGRSDYEKTIMDTIVALKMDTRSQFLRSVELLSLLSEAEREVRSHPECRRRAHSQMAFTIDLRSACLRTLRVLPVALSDACEHAGRKEVRTR